MIAAVSFFNHGRKVVYLPMNNCGNRNRLIALSIRKFVAKVNLICQTTDLGERHAMRAGAVFIQHAYPLGIDVFEEEKISERHRAAQVRHTRIVPHHPEPFAGPR